MLAAGVAAISVLAGIWWGRGVSPPAGAPPASVGVAATATVTADPATARIVVHVAGWVARPGLVEIAEGSRVGDALAAAGGLRPGAALDALNLAAVVSDGQQITVPGPGGPDPARASAGPAGAPDDGMVHLNSATATELESLPGVGPVLAERIVAHRDDNGAYERVEDLLEVSGIGEAKLDSMRDLVTVP